jgi:hypothetical protein
MNNDLVIVESTSINNESVPVVFQVAEVRQGEVMDQRELSRSFVFEDFQAKIPLKLAKILVKQSPQEFKIVDSAEENPSKEVLDAIRISKEVVEGFSCEFCEESAKSKAGLTAHIRYNHPEEWAKLSQKKEEAKK